VSRGGREEGEEPVEADKLQEIAARDQFWSSLRALLPEIERLAQGEFADDPRERDLVQLLARVVSAELQFRARQTEPD
jgi:hypothetical protein